MSVASQINRIKGNISAAYTAITGKGGTEPATKNSANLATAIESIPSGGGGGGWTRPTEWPHIDEILAGNATAQQYSHKLIILYAPYTPNAVMSGSSGQYYILDSAPSTAVINQSSTTITLPQDGNYHWIIRCSNNPMFCNNMMGTWIHCENAVLSQICYRSSGSPFYGNNNLYEVSGTLDTSLNTEAKMMFGNCYSLRKVPEELIFSNCTDVANLFYFCNSLIEIPDIIDFSASTGTSGIFQACYNLRKLPTEMNFSMSTGLTAMFSECIMLESLPDIDCASGDLNAGSQSTFAKLYSLRALPKITNVRGGGINFGYCSNVSRDSLAVFNNGEITGGLAYTITRHPDYTTTDVTMTLPSALKSRFTSAEQQTIASALTAKHITLAW